MLTVEDLFEMMEYLMEKGRCDEVVRFLSQPSWPFYYTISAVGEYDGNILLVEGSQDGYGCRFDDVEDIG